jgi:hypothetical protein
MPISSPSIMLRWVRENEYEFKARRNYLLRGLVVVDNSSVNTSSCVDKDCNDIFLLKPSARRQFNG